MKSFKCKIWPRVQLMTNRKSYPYPNRGLGPNLGKTFISLKIMSGVVAYSNRLDRKLLP